MIIETVSKEVLESSESNPMSKNVPIISNYNAEFFFRAENNISFEFLI